MGNSVEDNGVMGNSVEDINIEDSVRFRQFSGTDSGNSSLGQDRVEDEEQSSSGGLSLPDAVINPQQWNVNGYVQLDQMPS